MFVPNGFLSVYRFLRTAARPVTCTLLTFRPCPRTTPRFLSQLLAPFQVFSNTVSGQISISKRGKVSENSFRTTFEGALLFTNRQLFSILPVFYTTESRSGRKYLRSDLLQLFCTCISYFRASTRTRYIGSVRQKYHFLPAP